MRECAGKVERNYKRKYAIKVARNLAVSMQVRYKTSQQITFQKRIKDVVKRA